MSKHSELAAHIARHVTRTGMVDTAISRLSLFRADEPIQPLPAVYEASLCLIAQGSKRVSLSDQSLTYDAEHYLLVSLDLPLIGHVTQASPDAPYLCAKIDIDQSALVNLIMEEGERAPKADLPALAVYRSNDDLADAACRLLRLLDRPEEIPALAPLIEREIVYRLLTGPHGPALRYMAVADSHLNQVSRAIKTIRSSFDQRIHIKDIAAAAGMRPVVPALAFQDGDAHDSLGISEAAAASGSAAAHAFGRRRRRVGRLCGGLQESLAVQSRVFPPVRRTTPARRYAFAKQRKYSDATLIPSWPNMGRFRTVRLC